ncbi:MAG: hypothetical protein KDD62_14950, partial [Bdellovibrionales bacterium]|nr:hypothetical protein [Bdellovibrionales bacterium]
MVHTQKVQSSTPWEALELQDFLASRQAFYETNPHLGPHGSAANLGKLSPYTAPVNARMKELVNLVDTRGAASGLCKTNYDERLTILHPVTPGSTTSFDVSTGIKLAQLALGGQGIAYSDGAALRMSLKNPVPLISNFMVEQELIVGDEYHHIAVLGPGLLRLDETKLNKRNSETDPWKAFFSMCKGEADYLAQEHLAGASGTCFVVRESSLRHWDPETYYKEVSLGLRNLLQETPNTDEQNVTVLFVKPGSFLDNFYSAALTLGEIIETDLSAHPSISALEARAPLAYDPTKDYIE